MRVLFRLAIAASILGALQAGAVLAQSSPVGAQILLVQAGNEPAKQIALTQKQIDGVIASQPAIQAIEAKLPQGGNDKPDPKVEAQLEAVAKKNGFSGIAEYSDVTSTIGIVMAGFDPATKAYIGPAAVLKKQIDEVKADKKMPPKEKKEALAELQEAMGAANSAQPLPANIAIVTKNYDALIKSMQQDSN